MNEPSSSRQFSLRRSVHISETQGDKLKAGNICSALLSFQGKIHNCAQSAGQQDSRIIITIMLLHCYDPQSRKTALGNGQLDSRTTGQQESRTAAAWSTWVLAQYNWINYQYLLTTVYVLASRHYSTSTNPMSRNSREEMKWRPSTISHAADMSFTPLGADSEQSINGWAGSWLSPKTNKCEG